MLLSSPGIFSFESPYSAVNVTSSMKPSHTYLGNFCCNPIAICSDLYSIVSENVIFL